MMQKVDFRTLTQGQQDALRLRGFALLRDGARQVDVARALGVSTMTAWKWSRILKSDPDRPSQSAKRGPRPESSERRKCLNAKQREELRATIIDKAPSDVGVECCLWTLRAIRACAKSKYGPSLSDSTLRRYLKSWGMTPQRPARKAIQMNPEKVGAWLREEYPAIVVRAHAEHARIVWEDETAVKQDTNWVRGYAPAGKTPEIAQDRTAAYGAPAMLSALDNRGWLQFRIQKGAVKAVDFLGFLKALVADSMGGKVFVVLDNARFHRAKIVREWAEENKGAIELFYLPAYAPTLNPDEFVNRQLKTHLRLLPAMDHEDAARKATAFMESLRGSPSTVAKVFASKSVAYASEDSEVAQIKKEKI